MKNENNKSAESMPERIDLHNGWFFKEVGFPNCRIYVLCRPDQSMWSEEHFTAEEARGFAAAMAAPAAPSQTASEIVRAIKAIRAEIGPHNCGLKEAKDAYEEHGSVDKAVAALKAESRHASGSPSQGVTPRQDAVREALDTAHDALENIAIFGCGMLNQPMAANGPNELWLEKRIREYERVAHTAMSAIKTAWAESIFDASAQPSEARLQTALAVCIAALENASPHIGYLAAGATRSRAVVDHALNVGRDAIAPAIKESVDA